MSPAFSFWLIRLLNVLLGATRCGKGVWGLSKNSGAATAGCEASSLRGSVSYISAGLLAEVYVRGVHYGADGIFLETFVACRTWAFGVVKLAGERTPVVLILLRSCAGSQFHQKRARLHTIKFREGGAGCCVVLFLLVLRSSPIIYWVRCVQYAFGNP